MRKMKLEEKAILFFFLLPLLVTLLWGIGLQIADSNGRITNETYEYAIELERNTLVRDIAAGKYTHIGVSPY